MRPDVIFAVASGAGRAAVAVIRLSGVGTDGILEAVTGDVPAPRLAVLRRLRHPDTGETLDRALVLRFPGPSSYTGEDAAELHVHGGPAVIRAVAEALAIAGARPAEAGEFTRRAFVNGKLDLTAAEGIADLIAAETAGQRRQALRQADGALGVLYGDWAARLTKLLARQEAFIEFEDDDLPAGLDDAVAVAASHLAAELRAHLADGRQGERLRDGIHIVILGAPNAGKSSLLNALAERDVAIVSPLPGTTRDLVEVRLDLGGVPVTLTDTAGLRDTADEVEAEGVRRARRVGVEADLVLAMFATDQAPDAATLGAVGSATLVIASKLDLLAAPSQIGGAVPLGISVRTGIGLPTLRERLTEAVTAKASYTTAPLITRARHRAALEDALGWLDEIHRTGLPELRAEALRAAVRAVGRITGHVGMDAVLDAIFGEFCIGK